jgi:hypothetical protein
VAVAVLFSQAAVVALADLEVEVILLYLQVLQ